MLHLILMPNTIAILMKKTQVSKLVIVQEFQNTKKFFVKGHTTNWLEEAFLTCKIKDTVPWTYVINILNDEEITVAFCEKKLQKANQKEFRIEKVIKRKVDKLFVKWKGYDNSSSSWIDKKGIV